MPEDRDEDIFFLGELASIDRTKALRSAAVERMPKVVSLLSESDEDEDIQRDVAKTVVADRRSSSSNTLSAASVYARSDSASRSSRHTSAHPYGTSLASRTHGNQSSISSSYMSTTLVKKRQRGDAYPISDIESVDGVREEGNSLAKKTRIRNPPYNASLQTNYRENDSSARAGETRIRSYSAIRSTNDAASTYTARVDPLASVNPETTNPTSSLAGRSSPDPDMSDWMPSEEEVDIIMLVDGDESSVCEQPAAAGFSLYPAELAPPLAFNRLPTADPLQLHLNWPQLVQTQQLRKKRLKTRIHSAILESSIWDPSKLPPMATWLPAPSHEEYAREEFHKRRRGLESHILASRTRARPIARQGYDDFDHS